MWFPLFNFPFIVPTTWGGDNIFLDILSPPPIIKQCHGVGVVPFFQLPLYCTHYLGGGGGGIKLPRIFYPPPPIIKGLMWFPFFNFLLEFASSLKFAARFVTIRVLMKASCWRQLMSPSLRERTVEGGGGGCGDSVSQQSTPSRGRGGGG